MAPGGKRGRNEVSSFVVLGFSYWNIREHPLPVDGHDGNLREGGASAGAFDCGVKSAPLPRPYQGIGYLHNMADIWRNQYFCLFHQLNFTIYSFYIKSSSTKLNLFCIFLKLPFVRGPAEALSGY